MDDFTWYDDVKTVMEELGMDPEEVRESTKSSVKRRVKESVSEKMTERVNHLKQISTKMRFINYSPNYGIKKYIIHNTGTDALHTIKTRMNMQEIYGNFKGNLKLPRLCPHCVLEDDTTEHLLECTYFGPTSLSRDDLRNDENVELWRQINERTRINLRWR